MKASVRAGILIHSTKPAARIVATKTKASHCGSTIASKRGEGRSARPVRLRIDLEARNLERRGEAEIVGMRMDGAKVVLVRQASDMGQLYGSVSARDIAEGLIEGGYNVERRQVVLDRAIKTLGLHPVRVMLHPEVTITVEANVARTVEEAERQEAGIFFDDPDQDELDELEGEAEALFEPADDAAASEEAHGEETEGEEAVRAAVSDEKTVTPA